MAVLVVERDAILELETDVYASLVREGSCPWSYDPLEEDRSRETATRTGGPIPGPRQVSRRLIGNAAVARYLTVADECAKAGLLRLK